MFHVRGNPGFTAARGFNPAGGAPGGDSSRGSDVVEEEVQQRTTVHQQMLLELAIAKRCRLHKLIRQRFTLALKIQQEDVAMVMTSRRKEISSRWEIQSQALVQAQEKKKQAKRRDSISRKIQSQDFSRSTREAVVDLNKLEQSS
ncbi:hypothetical protein F511_30797 [Dorcoceras hygrometricum]|uniref:Uncharacterized protein n=1 Tax=Dorcoceras hygrometricum TaxID=472368 RepID=A0A2Z7A5V4_9LAMI|nr:hypothetical protein F511_30797 [Dorcoceras hygrometricum]